MSYQTSLLQIAAGAVGAMAFCAALNGTAAPLASDGAKAKAGVSVKNEVALDTPPAANLVQPSAVAAVGAVKPNGAPSTANATSAPIASGTNTVKDPEVTPKRRKPKLAIRGRLDDGRSLGFRQHAEDFRTNDPVQAETDRLQRSRQAPAK